uniref:Kinesin family member 25 n=1 Tax=Saimiri boliviensis boliviensis TaxID=39432 RepID=A0A2K6V206_SAIBB
SAVFGDVCPLLRSLLDGCKVCVMAYGETGSGKTYPMLGSHSDDNPVLLLLPQRDLGIIPRAAEELFRLISENPSRISKVGVSIMEVYNKDVFDPLAKDSVAAVSGVKREVMTAKDSRIEVVLLVSEGGGSTLRLVELVSGGLQLRAKHATLVHVDSSQSHLIITMTLTTVTCSDSTTCGATLPREGTEAGRAERSHSACLRAPQLVPGDAAECMEQVQARPQPVDLADSKGVSEGDAKLLVILCVSPSQRHLAQRLWGLSFGTRAQRVQRGPLPAEGKMWPD